MRFEELDQMDIRDKSDSCEVDKSLNEEDLSINLVNVLINQVQLPSTGELRRWKRVKRPLGRTT